VYQVDTSDPRVFAIVVGVLAAAGLLAGWLPARRAARVDPVMAMRNK
jgi:ABC-type antimicrobial peptide transport system permease subunit